MACFVSWIGLAIKMVLNFCIGIDLGADAAKTSHQLQQIPDKKFKIVVANLCCYVDLINKVAGSARSLGLLAPATSCCSRMVLEITCNPMY